MNLFLLDDGRLRAEWRFLISLIVVVLMNLIAGAVSAIFGESRPHLEDLIYRPLLALLLLGSFVAMAKLLDQPQGSAATYLGLPWQGWLKQSLAGALLGFVLIFLAILFIAIFCNYEIVRLVLNPRALKLPLIVSFILLTGAMAEELMFRGYPFQRLVESIGKFWAIVALSALFGAVHLGNPHISDNRAVEIFAFTNTLLVGVVFAIAYLRTRALWFPWGLHFSWNLTMGLIFGLPVSGITNFSVLVHARANGPAWFLGGGYGLEGGLLGTLVLLLGLGYVLLFVHPMPPEKPQIQIDDAASSGIQSTVTN